MKPRAVLLVVALLVLVSVLAFWYVSSNTTEMAFTLRIDAQEESEPLDGQNLKVEGYIVYLPFERVFARGRVTIGGYVLRIERFAFVGNIVGLRKAYTVGFAMDRRQGRGSDGPHGGSAHILGNLQEKRIEEVLLIVWVLKDKDFHPVSLRAFPK